MAIGSVREIEPVLDRGCAGGNARGQTAGIFQIARGDRGHESRSRKNSFAQSKTPDPLGPGV